MYDVGIHVQIYMYMYNISLSLYIYNIYVENTYTCIYIYMHTQGNRASAFSSDQVVKEEASAVDLLEAFGWKRV